MSIPLFDRRTMLDYVKTQFPPNMFFRNTFFGGPARERDLATNFIDWDSVSGGRKLAPLVASHLPGKNVARSGYVTKTFTPPMVKPKMVTTAEDILKRQPGQTVYDTVDNPMTWARQQLASDLDELNMLINRREEWMCSSVLSDGTITFTGDGVDTTVDFGMPAEHKVELTGGDLWSDSGSDPINDLLEWVRLVRDASGIIPTKLIMGNEAADAFINHPSVGGDTSKSLFNNQRLMLGQISPQAQSPGVELLGFLTRPNLEIYGYSEIYTDDDGNPQNMMPVDKIFLGSDMANDIFAYGAIEHLKAPSLRIRRFVHTWEEDDPSVRNLIVMSRPMPVMRQPEAHLTAKVV